MNLINIDTEKCIKCGLCVNDCPEQILQIGENGPECSCSQNLVLMKQKTFFVQDVRYDLTKKLLFQGKNY